MAQKVRKAVIPVAGLGTRHYPASRVLGKALLALVDRDGLTKPLVQIIAREALNAGIESICLVVSPQQREPLEAYFRPGRGARPPGGRQTESMRRGDRRVREIAEHLCFVVQESPEGFGHAVWCARDFVADEPFLVLLGDSIYLSHEARNCAAQLIDAFREEFSALTSVARTHESLLARFGTIRGQPVDSDERLYEAERIVEKPTLAFARQHLRSPGLPADQYLCHFGSHVFSPAVMEMLTRLVRDNVRQRGEIQLTTAQEMVRRQFGRYYVYEVRGRRYDAGVPAGLIEAQLALAMQSPYREQLEACLAEHLQAVQRA